MGGILIVSHGNLAEALISSVGILIESLQNVRGVSIWPQDGKDEIQDRIEREIAEVDSGEGVIILTDLLGEHPPTSACLFWTISTWPSSPG